MGKSCSACRHPLEFIKTKNGKNMPCEAQPIDPADATQGDVYITDDGETIHFDETNLQHADQNQLWIPHWTNCGGASSFRRPKS